MNTKLSTISAFLVLAGSALAGTPAQAETVKVGGYVFEPFVTGEPGVGLTHEIIDHWNASQDTYSFTFELTSAQRRYRGMADEQFDIMLFENTAWGWEGSGAAVTASEVFMGGGELYVARGEDVPSQDYFANFSDKSLAIMSGFHYGFADFNADRSHLNANFDVTITSEQAASLRLVAAGRADVAVVTQAFYDIYGQANPEMAAPLVAADTLDQEYRHTVLVGARSPISVEEVNALLAELQEGDTIARLMSRVAASIAE